MMKNLYREGFTLVELLIVIMAIAILAAIALPSYQRVVERARQGEAKYILGTMYRAWSRYYDAQGEDKPSLTDLDIDLPTVQGGPGPSTQHWNYIMSLGTSVPPVPVVAYADRIGEPASGEYKHIGITKEGNFVFW